MTLPGIPEIDVLHGTYMYDTEKDPNATKIGSLSPLASTGDE